MMLDPVTLAVVQNGLRQVATEMDLVHEKTSFSPVISEAYDRSNGIYDRATGEVVAQGELGLPIFVGVMQFTTQAVIERRKDLDPGDVPRRASKREHEWLSGSVNDASLREWQAARWLSTEPPIGS